MKQLLTILFFFPLLIGAQTYQPGDTVFSGNGEYARGIINHANGYLYGYSNNSGLTGTNGASSPGIATHCVTSPSTQTFKSTWAALHGFYGVGIDGYIYAVGDNGDGQYGDGTSTSVSGTYKLTVDSAGNAFNNIVAVAAFFSGNAHNGALAIKSDGTLWVWGNLTDNMRGNGTGGGTFVKPVQVAIPGGRQAIQVVAGFIAIVLCSDGTVWSFGSGTGGYASLGYAGSGSQWATIHQVTGLSGITQIAGGEYWNYAYNATTNKLYRWGLYGNYMGKSDGTGSGRGNAISLPEEATELEAGLGMPTLSIRQIVVNSDATAVIMSDGTLHTWGDNVQGCIGNGTELNFATYTFPYSYDLGTPGGNLQITPVQVGWKTDWKAIYGGSVFTYYFIAIDYNYDEYGWGRNKTAIILAVTLATSDLVAQYPNSLDVTRPTKTNALSNTKCWFVTSPRCLSNPGDTYCSEFSHGPYSALTVTASGPATTTLTTISLVGTSTDTTLQHLWTVDSGPGTPHFKSNTDANPTVTNLQAGSYVFRHTATNNGFVTYSATTTVTVTTSNCSNCIQTKVKINFH